MQPPNLNQNAHAAMLTLNNEIAAARSFHALWHVRQQLMAMAGLTEEDLNQLENALSTRERELMKSYLPYF